MKYLSMVLILIGATIAMSQTMVAVDPATDPNIDPQIRTFLNELNKDTTPFWEKPGPEVRATLTGLQAKTPVDLSGITIAEKTISENDRKVKLYIVKPEKVQGTPPVILFIHGGVWLAGNFENHNVIGVEISGQLWAQPIPIDLLVRTEIDLETGQVEIADLASTRVG